MKAGELSLQGTLNSPNQYIIPVFQRYYSWGKENWQQLWDDLLEMVDPEHPKPKHFMGALVFVPEKHYSYKTPAYHVIDGQQRIVTLSLLLCAIRDAAKTLGFDKLAAEVTETCLVHPFKSGQEHYRVYPRQRDREDYLAAVDGDRRPNGNTGTALQFFKKNLGEVPNSNSEEGLRAFFNGLQNGLEFVHISLEDENPYSIFRSLNSTGIDLSEADLIRNFVFMHVPLEKQDSFDDEFWRVLENRFQSEKGEVDASSLSAFFRDFLMRDGQYVSPAGTFEHFEKAHEVATFDPYRLVQGLCTNADFYGIMRGVSVHLDPVVDSALQKLRDLESSTAYPLLLNLMRRVNEGSMSNQDFAEAIELLSGFIMRRFICGDSSRAYGRWFVSACKELGAAPLADLESFLASKGFPGDARFTAHLAQANLYDSRYCRSVLERLERAQPRGPDSKPSKEQADLSQTQIEHVMPKTLTAKWREHLGPEAERVYEQWLNSVGNLTLTAYNTPLSNKPFDEKRKEYAMSKVTITQTIASLGSWTEKEIKQRGESLAESAADIWIGPEEEAADVEELNVQGNPYRPGSSIGTLFDILSDGKWHHICDLQTNIPAKVERRLRSIRRRGKRHGQWELEYNGERVRLTKTG